MSSHPNGGMPARGAVVRWSWRLFRRDWRQHVLIVVLLLLVANPGNDVVQFIFNVTQPFVEPFLGMFSLNRVTADQGSVFDIAALVALIAWTLVEAIILAGIRIFARRPETV